MQDSYTNGNQDAMSCFLGGSFGVGEWRVTAAKSFPLRAVVTPGNA